MVAATKVSGAWALRSNFDSGISIPITGRLRLIVFRLPLVWRGCVLLTAVIAATWPDAMAAQQPTTLLAPQQLQQSADWIKLPKMELERQFAGRLQDTIIQRLRDPVDGRLRGKGRQFASGWRTWFRIHRCNPYRLFP